MSSAHRHADTPARPRFGPCSAAKAKGSRFDTQMHTVLLKLTATALALVVVDVQVTMRGRIGGVFTVIDALHSPDLEAGALQRHRAECVWFPPALLPGRGVQWTAIDDKHAIATLTDGQTAASLEFRFAPTGEIVSAFTPTRSRERERRVRRDAVGVPPRRLHRARRHAHLVRGRGRVAVARRPPALLARKHHECHVHVRGATRCASSVLDAFIARRVWDCASAECDAITLPSVGIRETITHPRVW